jgi:hypothetical protein
VVVVPVVVVLLFGLCCICAIKRNKKKQKIEEPASQAPHMAIAIETPGPAPALAPVATLVHQRQVQTTTPAGEWTNQLDAVSASQVSVVLPVAEPATSAPIVVEASPAKFAADAAQEAQQRRLSSMRNTDDNEELHNMDVKQLRLKAAAMGVGEDDVEEARDSDDPRHDLTALIVAQADKKAATEQEQARIEQERLDQIRAEEKAAAEQEQARIEQERLDQIRAEEDFRQELSAMNMKQLRLKAAAVGAGEDDVEEARDSDDPRRDLTALVLGLHCSGLTTQAPSQSPGGGMYRP